MIIKKSKSDGWLNPTKKRTLASIVFLLPSVLLLACFMAYPILNTFIVSFTNSDGLNRFTFIGIKNYIEIFTSQDFATVFTNNLILLILGVPLTVIIPLVIAVLLFSEVPGFKVFRTLFLLPSVLSVIVTGILYRTIFAYDGPVNAILNFLGLDYLAVPWLSERFTAIPIIIMALIWSGFGTNVIIFLAGMAAINISVYEAAELDGVNPLQKLLFITLPMIRRIIEFVTVMSIINVFAYMFGFIYTLTGGGPGYETATMDFFLYIKGFRANEVGYASAVAVLLFIIMAFVSRFTMTLFAKGGDDIA